MRFVARGASPRCREHNECVGMRLPIPSVLLIPSGASCVTRTLAAIAVHARELRVFVRSKAPLFYFNFPPLSLSSRNPSCAFDSVHRVCAQLHTQDSTVSSQIPIAIRHLPIGTVADTR